MQTPAASPSTAVPLAGTPPQITGLAPVSGPTTGGTTVTLTGSGFLGTTAVRFGTTPAASFTIVSPTTITAVSPPGTGTVQITVTTPGGISNGVGYSYLVIPVITGLSPGSGPTAGGTTVTITGTNLSTVTSVLFGATPAVSFTVVSATQITALTPPGAAGQVPVTVATPSAASAPATYFYVDLPAITSISPTLGPTAGGTTVTLTGANLLQATGVSFGGSPAASFTVVSGTQIQAVAPPGTGSVPVGVTTPGGTATGPYYTYVAAPTVTDVVPPSGPTSAGTVVTVTGTGLTYTTAVTFDGVPSSFSVVSDTLLTAVAPAGSAGPVAVAVTTPGGTASGSYTRVAPPGI